MFPAIGKSPFLKGSSGTGGAPAPFNQFSILFDGVDELLRGTSYFGDIDFKGQAFSFSVWFKLITQTDNALLSIFPTTGTNFSAGVAVSSGGFLQLSFNRNDGLPTDAESIHYDTPLVTGQWYHVVCTHNGGAVNVTNTRIYLDGVDETDSEGASTWGGATNNNTYQVGRSGSTSFHANANIEEPAVFDIALSAAEVTEIYNSGSPNDLSSHSQAANLRLWLRMGDDPSDDENTIIDQTANNNDATGINLEAGDIEMDVP